jgi:ArsR family transcriptional regulator, arsenate/arsenite/antimonite-responsive transcriptional repressor
LIRSLFVERRTTNEDTLLADGRQRVGSDRAQCPQREGTAMTRPAPTPATVSDERLAALAKALGHPARVRIVRLLRQRASCVTGDLAPELGLAPSTVSEHLRILREAGLINTVATDGRPCYCLSSDGLRSLTDAIERLA